MPTARTAILVVAGVGDERRGQAAERIADGLARHQGWVVTTLSQERYPVPARFGAPADVAGQDLSRIAVQAPDGACADVYEFWWADQSRFPAAQRGFLVALFGLLLQAPGVARAAIRSSGPIRARAPWRKLGAPRRIEDVGGWLLVLLDWFLAVPVMLVSVAALALVGALLIAAPLDGSAAQAPALVLFGVAALVVAVMGVRAYTRDTGRRLVPHVAAVLATGAAAAVVVRLADGRPDHLALGDVLAGVVAYGVRGAWLAIAVCVVAMIALLVHLWAGAEDRRRLMTVVVGVTAGALGFALVVTSLIGAVGAAGILITNEQSGAPGVPVGLAGPADWTLSQPARNEGLWQWGVDLFAVVLGPLSTAALVAAALLGLLVLLGVGAAVHGRLKYGAGGDAQAHTVNLLLRAVDSRLGLAVACLGTLAAALAVVVAWTPLRGEFLGIEDLSASRPAAARCPASC